MSPLTLVTPQAFSDLFVGCLVEINFGGTPARLIVTDINTDTGELRLKLHSSPIRMDFSRLPNTAIATKVGGLDFLCVGRTKITLKLRLVGVTK